MKTRTYPLFLPALSMTVMILTATLAMMGGPPEQTKPLDLQGFMVQKRAYSQIVLDGLMSEDYQTIIIAGENMRKMRADKRWERLTSDEYKRHSEDFEKAAQSMVDAARRRNLDGCMNSYMTCLRACYDCHKYVRAFPVPASFEAKPLKQPLKSGETL